MKGAAKGHVVGATMNPASGRIHMPGSILAQLTQGEDLADGIREDNIRYQKTAGRGRKTAKRRAVQLAAVLHASYQPMEGLRIDPDF